HTRCYRDWSSDVCSSDLAPMMVVDAQYEVHFLHGPVYRRNVSVARLRNHREIAREFRLAAPKVPAPDLILCSLPPLELCVEAVKIGRASCRERVCVYCVC